MNLFSDILLKWYSSHKRELPWRTTADPYLIWISEIILQQTRVAQGYEYYIRFVNRFPDVESLASASEDEVMKYWQGLGYYSRARNLHEAAKSMNGTFPTTYKEVRALKGVGDYTAAAICSAVYAMPYAVVDGNVYRVLSRYFEIETPIDTTEGKKVFAALADEMLDAAHPGEYNQAIMDFGALQCTPQSPDCTLCPLADSCSALASGRVKLFPMKFRKPLKTRKRYFNYMYVRVGEEYTLIRRRSKKDIWQNMFELPLLEFEKELSVEAFLASTDLHSFLGDAPNPVIRPLLLGVKHVLSHQVIYANFYEVILSQDIALFPGYQKIKREDLEQYAVPRLIHAFLEKYG